jgi:C4-dicarboxylate transporter DctM subunit
MTLGLLLLALVALLLTGPPIFAALGLISMALMVAEGHSVASLADVVFGKLNIYLLVAIPLFAFMAHLLIRARVMDDLFAAAQTLVRPLPGGLGVATVLSCTLFAAISGSSVATALTVGATAIPQMKRFGYRPEAAYGAVAAGGTLGILIPPSGPMILYAVVADVSIGALFLAGLVPGLMMAGLFALWSILGARAAPGQPPARLAEIGAALRKAVWALLMPPIVLGGIYMGVFTATEAAAVGAVLALLIGTVIYRALGLRAILDCARETARTTAMLFLILAGAAMFGHVITLMRLPMDLLEGILALGLTPEMFLVLVMLAILVLGMFLETISIILVTTPLLLPALAHFGIDPVWYGILLMINLEMALITPPVGMNLFVIKGVARAPMAPVIRGTLPYVGLMLLALVAVFLVPGLATSLPEAAGFMGLG